MKNKIDVEIISVEGYLFQGQAHQVVVPAVEGNIGVMPGHEFLVSELREGKVEILDLNDNILKDIEVKTGTVEIHDGGLRILVDS